MPDIGIASCSSSLVVARQRQQSHCLLPNFVVHGISIQNNSEAMITVVIAPSQREVCVATPSIEDMGVQVDWMIMRFPS